MVCKRRTRLITFVIWSVLISCCVYLYCIYRWKNNYDGESLTTKPLNFTVSNRNITAPILLSLQAQKNIKAALAEPKTIHHPLFLLLFILTTPDNINIREVIRNTWANCEDLHTLMFESRYIPSEICCRRVFVLGRSKQNKTDTLTEAKRFQDMLVFDYEESYPTIYFKVISMFNWVIKYSVRWIFKADDDVYVHVPRLILKLSTLRPVRFYGGKLELTQYVNRNPNAKNYISRDRFSPHRFPPFASWYALSSDLAPKLLSAVNNFSRPFIDDVYVGVLMKHIGVVPQHLKEVWQRKSFRQYVPDSVLKRWMLFSHMFKSSDIEKLHQRMKSFNLDETFCNATHRKYITMNLNFN